MESRSPQESTVDELLRFLRLWLARQADASDLKGFDEPFTMWKLKV